MVELLRSHKLNVNERSYAVNIQDCECFSIEFDRDSEDEASFEGTAAALATLVNDVALLVNALRAADITFWIEITDSIQNPLHYYHNHWPEE